MSKTQQQGEALVATLRSFVDRKIDAAFRLPDDASLVERVVDARVKGTADALARLTTASLVHDGRLLELESRLAGFVREMHEWAEAVDERLRTKR